jgi:probable F420-dependent oxidoreductase
MVAFGCTLPGRGPTADAAAYRAVAQAADELGYDSVWVSDHVVIPAHIASSYPYSPDGDFGLAPTHPYLEPLVTLGFLAAATRRARLGIHVLVLPYRHAVLAAKMLATLDYLSNGRLDLGIGVGWMREEFEALGQPHYDRRGALTDEQVAVYKRLWTEDTPSFAGEFYRFEPIGAFPHPVQRPHPPIWVGGHTRPAIRRAGRLGDGWLPIGARPPADLPPPEIAAGLELLRAEARRHGRDPDAIGVCFSTTATLTDTASAAAGVRRPFQGNPDEIVADAAGYRQVGVQRFIFGLGPLAPADYERQLHRFATQVGPGLAGL